MTKDGSAPVAANIDEFDKAFSDAMACGSGFFLVTQTGRIRRIAPDRVLVTPVSERADLPTRKPHGMG